MILRFNRKPKTTGRKKGKKETFFLYEHNVIEKLEIWAGKFIALAFGQRGGGPKKKKSFRELADEDAYVEILQIGLPSGGSRAVRFRRLRGPVLSVRIAANLFFFFTTWAAINIYFPV